MNKWDKRFLDLAKLVSTWSKDPSTQVGAVIIDEENRVVSLGFNGLPQDIYDDEEIYNNREEKYRKIVHAEMNAIIFAQRDLKGCTLYTYPFLPCNKCAAMVIQTGISKVVSYQTTNERWVDELEESKKYLIEGGCVVTQHKKYDNSEIVKHMTENGWIPVPGKPGAYIPEQRTTNWYVSQYDIEKMFEECGIDYKKERKELEKERRKK
jgi:dCMP deaminase